MTNKLFEIRDRYTLVPALAIQVSGFDGYLMRRAGFNGPMVYLVELATQKAHYDPYTWGNRTMRTAHQFIEAHFEELASGDVIDVEFILGESTTKKQSESEWDEARADHAKAKGEGCHGW